mgnify:CR=1 FL=1
MNNKGGPTLIGTIFFVLWPSIIAIAVTILLCCYFDKLSNNESLFIGAISGIISYSATASFFLLALPRNGVLKTLDKRKHTFSYTLALLSPAIIGIIQMFFLYLKSASVSFKGILFLSNLFFISTVFQFFWSLTIIFLIILKIRNGDINGNKN